MDKQRNEAELINILVNSMSKITYTEFVNKRIGYTQEELHNIWLRYWHLEGDDRYYFDEYHYKKTILRDI